jgi:hypothetical protein
MPLTSQDFVAKGKQIPVLYNQRSIWLDLAHKKLDAAGLNAYGWSEGMLDNEILEQLLKPNLKRRGAMCNNKIGGL